MAEQSKSTMNMVGIGFGALFGGILAAGRLHEYETIHRSLVLEDLYVFYTMAAAIAVATPLLWLLERRHARTALAGPLKLSRSMPERNHVVGGVLFGTGWAIAGTCPAPALVMVSSGAWLGLVAIAGIFLGLYLREIQTREPVPAGEGKRRGIPQVAHFGK